jgi:very-short-patch-repair endonuclease
MRDQLDSPDVAVARIAATQHGVVSVTQLHGVGLDKHGIRRRAQSGRLHRLHRGVYAVGHTGIGWKGRWMAAVLACGAGAALSHGSAAALWGLLRPAPGPVDVSVPTYAGRSVRGGIRLHRRGARRLDPIVSRRGISVTTPARTIADIEGVLAPHLVRRAIRQAEIAGLRIAPKVETYRTRSDLERDFLCLCRRHRIPAPEVNVKVGRWTVDFLWRRERLAVETDFYGYHRGQVAFQDDHARDLDLRRLGLDVRRFSELQVNDHAEKVATDLRDALALAS